MANDTATPLLSRRQFLAGASACGIAACLPVRSPRAAPAAPADRVTGAETFALPGYRTMRLGTGMFPRQWRDMVARYRRAEAKAPPGCAWNALRDGFRGRVRDAAWLAEIDDRLARYPYVSDIRQWGTSDYWATPREFLAHGGDCEDHAIAKYWLLRSSGIPIDNIAVITCRIRETGATHAITGCFLENKIYILDNLATGLAQGWPAWRYRPIYMVNETTWAIFLKDRNRLQAPAGV